MTVPNTVSRNDYLGNGATSVFSYTFRILEATDLQVTVADLDDAETPLVLGVDYTADGVKAANGGNVTLVNGGQAWLETDGDLITDYKITIRRVLPLTQTTDLRNGGPYFPNSVEDEFDRGIMIAQQRQDEVDRSLKLTETEAGTAAKTTLPSATDRASKVLGFDASGNPIPVSALPGGVTVTPYMETLLDDTDAPTARATLGVPLDPEEFNPASFGVNQNDYDVTSGGALRSFSDVRLTASAPVNITGLDGGFEGARIKIVNIGASAITLTHQDANSLAVNRMILGGGADVALGQNETIDLVYFTSDSLWRQYDAVTTAKILDDAVTTAKILNANVTLAKLAAAVAAALVPTGAMAIWTTDTAPTGYLLCYGQAVSRTTYAALFAVIDENYGVGDGSTTFALPDMRGRLPLGQDDMGGASADRVTHANADALGGVEGAEDHTLTITEMPAHNHPFLDQQGVGAEDGLDWFANVDAGGTTDKIIRNTGGDGAHENMPPYLTLNYIIKT